MHFLKRTILMLMVAILPVVAKSVEPKLFNKVDKQAMESWVNNTFNSMSPDNASRSCL